VGHKVRLDHRVHQNQADRPGFYFEPTVISGLKQHDEAIQNEIFGPVITVQKFTDENDAIENISAVKGIWVLIQTVPKSSSRERRVARA
jgi:acyl-CoA reductase-like NAD-dependent aldehyde dehydrogenase